MFTNLWYRFRNYSFFSSGSKTPNQTASSANQSTNSMFANVKTTNRYISRRSLLDFSTFPVFSTFLVIILVLNFSFFFISFFPTYFPFVAGLNKQFFPLYFTANNRAAVYYGFQFWRFFSYAFTETNTGFNILFSVLFVYLTFYRIGSRIEMIFGSLRTFVLLFFGVLIIGFLQFALSKFDTLYFYGTETLSLICVGAGFFYWLMSLSTNAQFNKNLRNLLIQVVILCFFIVIWRYSYNANFFELQPLEVDFTQLKDWTVFQPFCAFFFGFFTAALLMQQNYKIGLVFWVSFALETIFIFTAIGMLIYVLMNETPDKTFWINTLEKIFKK